VFAIEHGEEDSSARAVAHNPSYFCSGLPLHFEVFYKVLRLIFSFLKAPHFPWGACNRRTSRHIHLTDLKSHRTYIESEPGKLGDS